MRKLWGFTASFLVMFSLLVAAWALNLAQADENQPTPTPLQVAQAQMTPLAPVDDYGLIPTPAPDTIFVDVAIDRTFSVISPAGALVFDCESTTCNRLGTLPYPAQVTVIDERDGWIMIRLPVNFEFFDARIQRSALSDEQAIGYVPDWLLEEGETRLIMAEPIASPMPTQAPDLVVQADTVDVPAQADVQMQAAPPTAIMTQSTRPTIDPQAVVVLTQTAIALENFAYAVQMSPVYQEAAETDTPSFEFIDFSATQTASVLQQIVTDADITEPAFQEDGSASDFAATETAIALEQIATDTFFQPTATVDSARLTQQSADFSATQTANALVEIVTDDFNEVELGGTLSANEILTAEAMEQIAAATIFAIQQNATETAIALEQGATDTFFQPTAPADFGLTATSLVQTATAIALEDFATDTFFEPTPTREVMDMPTVTPTPTATMTPIWTMTPTATMTPTWTLPPDSDEDEAENFATDEFNSRAP